VPGYGDSDLRLQDEEISEKIRFRLVGMESRNLDVLFVFQSIADSTITLKSTFSRAQQIFGDEILQSTVVVLTKTDLKEPALTKRMKTVANICRPENVPYITWVNNSTESIIEDSQLNKQLAELKAALAKVKPYEMKYMEIFEKKVEQLAREMMDNDPTNNITKHILIPSQKVHIYNETVHLNYTTVQRAYSDEEVKRIAKLTQPLYKEIPVASYCEREVEVIEYEIITEERIKWYTTGFWIFSSDNSIPYETQTLRRKLVKKNIIEPCIKYVEPPIQEIEDALRRELKVVNATMDFVTEKMRLESSFEDMIITISLHDLSYYKSKVAMHLSQAKWKKG